MSAVRSKSIEPSHLHVGDMLRIGTVGMRARRLRSTLTVTGIAIGVAAMVAVLAISDSSRSELLTAIDRLGTNLLTVSAGQTLMNEQATLPEESVGMVERIGPVQSTSATAPVSASVRRTDLIPATQTGGISVLAARPDLLETLRGRVAHGAFLNAATERYPAVVLGSTAARRLGIENVDRGVMIWLGGHWFTVVGILEPIELDQGLDSAALIGFPVAEDIFGIAGSPGTIYVRVSPEHVADARRVLARTVNPENPNEVRVSRPSDALEARAMAATTLTTLFLGLGAVALIVAGFGVTNVILMSVLERRPEIGLRRALGATRRHIVLQFLLESLCLALMGGGVGVAAGLVVGWIYAASQDWPTVIPPAAVGVGMLAALVVGMVAGAYPALRAARISPTDALRTT